MRVAAVLSILGLLALTSASPALAAGATRVKRQGAVCSPKTSTNSTAGGATTTTSQAQTPSTSESGAAATANPLPDNSDSGIYPADPEGGGRRIRLAGRNDLCVTSQNGASGINSGVGISGCFSNKDNFVDEQLWDIPEQGTSGAIKVHSEPNLCFSTAINLGDCTNGPTSGQEFTWEANGQLRNNDNCLLVLKDSEATRTKPYISVRLLAMSPCDENDPLQKFALYDGPDVAPASLGGS